MRLQRAHASSLVNLADRLDEKKTFYVSKQAKSFFFQETEEGYLPSEHEVILLHIIASMSFLQSGDLDRARIEARKAAFYLEANFSAAGRFDDPVLRLWMVAVWLGLGDWQNAKVNLRVARQLLPNSEGQWMDKLLSSSSPPAFFDFYTTGNGMEVEAVQKDSATVLENSHRVKFIELSAGEFKRIALPGVSTNSWYLRHQERGFLARDVLERSRYCTESAALGL